MWTLRLPLSSPDTARRNARDAAAELLARRRQREEAERFLERHSDQARVAVGRQAARS